MAGRRLYLRVGEKRSCQAVSTMFDLSQAIFESRVPDNLVCMPASFTSTVHIPGSLVIPTMILGQVSYLDCLVFLLFLAPQLFIQVGFWNTLACVLRALPFLCMCLLLFFVILCKLLNLMHGTVIELPLSFIYDRHVTRPEDQTPFVRLSSAFEDVVVRCVRYAFANIPASIGRVFFSKAVALPFMRFRMLRYFVLSI